MEFNSKSILQMAGGAIMERVDYEMPLIVANISDPNTPTKTKRKLTVTLEFSVDESRQNIQVKAHSKSTLAPTEPVTTFLHITGDGEVVEMAPQIPGQFSIDGAEQEAPALLRLIK